MDKRFASLLTCAIGLLEAAMAYSSPLVAPATSSPFRANIIHKRGEVESVTWPVRPQITWTKASNTRPGTPSEMPRLQLLVHIPEKGLIAPEPGKESQFPKPVADSIFSTGQTYLAEPQGTAFIHRVLYRRTATSPLEPVALVLLGSEDSSAIATLSHPNCDATGVTFRSRQEVTSLKYVAIYCATEGPEEKRKLSVTGITSPELSIQSSVQAVLNGEEVTPRSIGKLVVYDKQEQRGIEIPLIYTPANTFRARTAYSIGLGASSYSYQEGALGGTRFSETALSGKFGATYNIVPRRFAIGLGGYATLVPLTSSPASLGKVRFYGLNGRLSYRLPIDMAGLDYTLLPGWYFWGMGGADFGISSGGGPQIFLQVANRPSDSGHGWWAYTKFAMMSQGGLHLAGVHSNELAVGGGYALNRSFKPWSVTLDVAQMKYSVTNNWLKLFSATGGIQKQF